MRIRPASEADIAFLMATERQPGYDRLVGRFTEDEHKANLRDATAAYQIAVGDDDTPLGFVLFRTLDDVHKNLYIKRVIVASPDKGTGTVMMTLCLNWAFGDATAERVWLTHLPDNHRARALYSKLGFQHEGVLRHAYGRADGTRGDLMQMSLLKAEWQALPKSQNNL